MSRWYLKRYNTNAFGHRNSTRSCSGDRAADEFRPYDREPYWRQPVRV